MVLLEARQPATPDVLVLENVATDFHGDSRLRSGTPTVQGVDGQESRRDGRHHLRCCTAHLGLAGPGEQLVTAKAVDDLNGAVSDSNNVKSSTFSHCVSPAKRPAATPNIRRCRTSGAARQRRCRTSKSLPSTATRSPLATPDADCTATAAHSSCHRLTRRSQNIRRSLYLTLVLLTISRPPPSVGCGISILFVRAT